MLRPRDRVRYAQNREETIGSIIAIVTEGDTDKAVVAWDDGFIDPDVGNIYDASELTAIDHSPRST